MIHMLRMSQGVYLYGKGDADVILHVFVCDRVSEYVHEHM